MKPIQSKVNTSSPEDDKKVFFVEKTEISIKVRISQALAEQIIEMGRRKNMFDADALGAAAIGFMGLPNTKKNAEAVFSFFTMKKQPDGGYIVEAPFRAIDQ
ncbi:MAG: hypothetical protein NTY07_07770 [Bacteroidia bacterium]|nr:hypothetical protein [Bacteroidia bacterium]